MICVQYWIFIVFLLYFFNKNYFSFCVYDNLFVLFVITVWYRTVQTHDCFSSTYVRYVHFSHNIFCVSYVVLWIQVNTVQYSKVRYNSVLFHFYIFVITLPVFFRDFFMDAGGGWIWLEKDFCPGTYVRTYICIFIPYCMWMDGRYFSKFLLFSSFLLMFVHTQTYGSKVGISLDKWTKKRNKNIGKFYWDENYSQT